MVPLINGAGRTLRWFIEDVYGHFDTDHARHGAPLFPSERKNAKASGEAGISSSTCDPFDTTQIRLPTQSTCSKRSSRSSLARAPLDT
jgi:hypothetical protein